MSPPSNPMQDPKALKDPSMAEVARRFTYCAPKGDQIGRYESIRSTARELALYIRTHCPDSEERKHSLACLQEAVMWANAAIAINE